MCKSLSLLAALLLTVSAVAQDAKPAAHPSFDVATVKPSAPIDLAKMAAEAQAGRMPKMGADVEATQAEYTYMALRDLIATAYGVRPYQIVGPDWLGSERFDILARYPQGASKDDAPAMLQTLLEDRFKLKVHRATQDLPVLALILGKNGPKLKEAVVPPAPFDETAPLKPGEQRMAIPGGGEARVIRNPDGSANINMGSRGYITEKMDFQTQTLRIESVSISVPGFVDMLNSLMQMGGGGGGSRLIVDQTGLKGYYQVSINLSLADILAIARSKGFDIPVGPNAPQAEPGGGSSVYESVDALGLKLDSRKAPIEQLIVDNVEKTPTAN
jgi:uncharacterized protein (TIGR03435 family)